MLTAGERMPRIRGVDSHGLFGELGSNRTFVLITMSTTCPAIRNNIGQWRRLASLVTSMGVRVVWVSSDGGS
jgi:hypothetical protein